MINDPPADKALERHGGYVVDASRAMGVQIGGGNTQIIYSYSGLTWTDGVAPPPLASVSGKIDSPYRGLGAFEERDAAFFFGREEPAARLLEQMSRLAAGQGLLMVSGASGAGKSSLLRAGVLPRLRGVGLSAAPDAAAWPCLMITPGPAPLDELAVRLAPIVGGDAVGIRQGLQAHPAALALVARQAALGSGSDPSESRGGQAGRQRRLLIIVDQFEQLFTQCPDEEERKAFISALHAAATARKDTKLVPAALVVLGVRADFEARCAMYPELAEAVQGRYLVTAMTDRQLRMVITEPVAKAGSRVQASLVDALLQEVRSRPAEISTGVLPLLSHALDQAWRSRAGDILTLADYDRTGGIERAVAASAQRAYDRLTHSQQLAARQVFTGLTAVSDEGADAIRRAATAEMTAGKSPSQARDVEAVLEAFASERLLTLAAGTVEISHEALLSAWPLLHDVWLAETHADRIVRTRLGRTTAEWVSHDHDPSYLYTGSLLETAAGTASRMDADPARHLPLGNDEREFLRQCTKAARSAYRRRRLIAILTVVLVIVAVISGYAFDQEHKAVASAVASSDYADSIQVALEAAQVRTQDPAVADQLSVASWNIARTPEAAAALLDSTDAPIGARVTDTSAVAQSTTVSPNHALMAVASADGALTLWDVTRPGHPALVDHVTETKAGGPLYAAAFSPDGRILAAAGAGGQVHMWNISDPSRPLPLSTLTGPVNSVYSLAFSPDGQLLAAGSADHHAWLWNVRNPSVSAARGRPLAGAAAAVNSIAFGLGGRVLAEGSADDRVRLWNLAGPVPVLAATLTGPRSSVSGVAFSSAGELAASSRDDRVWLWKVSVTAANNAKSAESNGVQPARAGKNKTTAAGSADVRAIPDGALTDSRNWANSVSFSPDDDLLAAATSEGSVLVWTMATHTLLERIPASQPVTSVVWDGSGRLADSDADGTATIWTLPPPLLLADNASTVVAYSPVGRAIAVGGSNVELWSAASHQLIASRRTPEVNSLYFSPDGRYLAAAVSDGTVQVMNAATLALIGRPLVVTASGFAESVAFSPDGRVLATGSDDGTVRLFSMASPAHPALLATVHDSGLPVYSVAFAPDGTMLAAASTDDETRLWNISNPATPQLDGSPLGGLSSYAIGLAFAPDSQLLAVSSADKTVRLWNIANPAQPVLASAPLTGPAGYAWAVAISPYGNTLAVGSTDGTVWLWDITKPDSPSLIATLTNAAAPVYSVAFAPDGTQLAASSYDGTVHFWDTSPDAAVTAICSDADEQLTQQEWSTHVAGLPYVTACPEH